MRKFIVQLNKYVVSHWCGNVVSIMPDLIDIGLDVLQSVQPEAMDPYMLKKEFGKDITFWEGLGSQSIIPQGKPDAIRTEIGRLYDVMENNGGYIFATAKQIQSDTPVENAVTIFKKVLERSGMNAAVLSQNTSD